MQKCTGQSKLDGSRTGKKIGERERSVRFKRYLKGQITEHGDGVDMRMMSDFRFCLV